MATHASSYPIDQAVSRSAWIVGTPQHFQWLHGFVKVVLILNLLDAVFTLIWVQAGFAQEANILLRDIVNHHPVMFCLVKTLLVSFGSWLLWRRRHHPLAVIGLFLGFMLYYSVLLYHLQFASLFMPDLLPIDF